MPKKILAFLTLISISAMSFLTIASASAVQDTCTWDGSASGDLSVDANYTCGDSGVPEAGDDFVFDNTGANKATTGSFPVIPRNVSVSDSGYTFAGALTLTNNLTLSLGAAPTFNGAVGLGGTINAFGSATFAAAVTFTNSTGQAGINIQNATPVFSGGVVMSITGAGFMSYFTTSSSLTVPSMTGSTPILNFSGNPTAPVEVYNLPTTAQTYTATSIGISRTILDCKIATCLGNAANAISMGTGEVAQGAGLRFSTNSFAFANPITFNNTGGGEEPFVATSGTITTTLTSDITCTTDCNLLTLDTSVFEIAAASDTALGANDLTYSGEAGSQFNQDGHVSGSGNVIVDPQVYLSVTGTQTYTGDTTIWPEATFEATIPSSLGTTAGDTTILDGGTLRLNPSAPMTIAENISVVGEGASTRTGAIELYAGGSDDYIMSGAITLDGDTTFGNAVTGDDFLQFSGAISGTGNLTLAADSDAGVIEFIGTAVNTYDGDTNVLASVFFGNRTGAGVSVPGDLNIISSLDEAFASFSDGSNQVADDSIVTLTEGTEPAVFNSGNPLEVFGTINGDGTIILGPDDGFTIGGGNKSGEFSGDFDTDSGTITKIGTGTWSLNLATTESATKPDFIIDEGIIIFNADIRAPISVLDGGILKGSGRVGDVVILSGGKISVGNSPGCMTLASLTLNSGSSFVQEINGPGPCTGYDQTTVSGALALGNATLNVSLGTNPPVGTVFTIASAASITGTFNGLQNNATFTSGGVQFRINYTATAVTLTVVAPASGTLPATGTSIAAVFFGLMLIAGGLVLVKRKRRVLV